MAEPKDYNIETVFNVRLENNCYMKFVPEIKNLQEKFNTIYDVNIHSERNPISSN